MPVPGRVQILSEIRSILLISISKINHLPLGGGGDLEHQRHSVATTRRPAMPAGDGQAATEPSNSQLLWPPRCPAQVPPLPSREEVAFWCIDNPAEIAERAVGALNIDAVEGYTVQNGDLDHGFEKVTQEEAHDY